MTKAIELCEIFHREFMAHFSAVFVLPFLSAEYARLTTPSLFLFVIIVVVTRVEFGIAHVLNEELERSHASSVMGNGGWSLYLVEAKLVSVIWNYTFKV